MTSITEVVVSALTRVWLTSSAESWRRLPKATDEPYVHAAGDNPDRVLIVGNGIAVSYGVLSHQIGFGGHFARQLAERTGRGSEVHLHVARDVDVRAARTVVAEARPARFDGIVLVLGGAEAIGARSTASWRRDLEVLLDLITEASPKSTEAFVVGVAPLGRIVRLPSFAQGTVERRIEEINAHARRACEARECATFIPFDPRGTDLMRTRDRTTYEEWGSLVAAGVAERLETNADRARAVESVDERERVDALESLGVLDQPEDLRLAQITDSARALFGVESASINFIDEDRQWVMARSGTAREDVPRTDAICDVTITRPGAFVINDAIAHPQFRELSMVREGRVRFYAGYPIEAPNGMRIGALCLTDPTPRAFSRADEALLRELALRAQALLRQGASA